MKLASHIEFAAEEFLLNSRIKASFILFIQFIFLLMFLNGVALAQQLRVGLVLDKGGRDDKSFNAAAFAGIVRAEKELKIKAKVIESADDVSFEPTMRALARGPFDLIIGVGFSQIEAIQKVSARYPQKKFALVDGTVDHPNVRSLIFEEHEGSFLVGALAALKSQQKNIGFIGGMDVPLIRRFQLGYEAGAMHINKNIRIQSQYIGVTGDSWNNPPKAKELALSQYAKGADIIFVAAGASSAGVFDAAEERKKLAIGVDSNQNWVKPGFILTSMTKHVDEAVFQTCVDLVHNRFTGGIKRFGLTNNGVAYAMDEHNKSLIPPDMLSKVETLRKDIISEKLIVPDYYKLGQKK